jgi:hypothetical protein
VRVECVDPRALIYDNCKMRDCVAVRGNHLLTKVWVWVHPWEVGPDGDGEVIS